MTSSQQHPQQTGGGVHVVYAYSAALYSYSLYSNYYSIYSSYSIYALIHVIDHNNYWNGNVEEMFWTTYCCRRRR